MSKINIPDISVVIPVYNGCLYIGQTLRSLLNQSFINFEIICVNDSSADSSLEILESFAKNDHRIKVFSKENGGTATSAIIYGLQYVTGKYFMYSSQDDLFSVDLLEKNYNKAIDSNADVVIPDMSYYWDTPVASQNNLGIYGIGGDRTKELSGREAFVLSLDWTIHGFALYRMDIIKKIGFSNYGLSSDEYSTRMFFFNSNKIAFSDGVFYYRQDNSEAITKKWSISQLGYIETCNRLEEFAFKNGFKENEIKIIYKTLLNELIRIQLLYSRNINNITQKDRGEYIKNIKMICKINSHKIKAIEVNNFKELVKKYLCLNYWGLVFLCKNIEYRLIYNNRV